jgi:hypothetical protein
MKFILNLLAFVIALLVGTLAGYAVLTAPMWALGAPASDMVLFGWVTGLPAMIVMGLVTIGTFAGLRKLLIA